MKTGRTLQELAAELVRQVDTKQDYVVRTSALELRSNGTSHLHMGATGQFELNDLAHYQVAEHLGIPTPYYSRLRAEHAGLLDANVNTLLKARPDNERRMVRTLDGGARAFLSDRYRRIDNFDLMEAILPTLNDTPGLEFASLEVTDRKLYVKVTTPRIQQEVKKGDVVQAGLMISNSEVGLAAVAVQPYSVRLVCTNGAVHSDFGTRKNHVGARIGETGEEAYRMFADETIQADDHAFFLKVRDIVKAAMTEETFGRIVEQMREAAGIKIEGDPVKAVEVLAKKYQLNQGERQSVLRNLVEGGDLSLWGVANAITRTAADAENYDRATDLEALGGNIITLPATDWREISRAA